MTFQELGLSENLLKSIKDAGYETPTPIQSQAIPVALQGRDILGCAQTGTGKTASFTLPMIEILSEGRSKARMPRSLILTPTRELAAQIAENFDTYGKHNRLTKALLIGGVDINAQLRMVETGVDVLICTPGRLLDVFERGGLMLTDIQILVIDEADRMMDMGFIPDVERIANLLPPLRQTLFFSATMAPAIHKIAEAFLQNPKEISVAPPASTATRVEHHLCMVSARDKRKALRYLIQTLGVTNAFIFCNRKRDVDAVATSLRRHGFSVGAIHGDMDQTSRMQTLTRFKTQDLTLLVASDVAARGIDIENVSHVFNFDIPTHAEDYVHRIGRTGRAGRVGHAYSLAIPVQDDKFIEAIEKLTGQSIPRHDTDGFIQKTSRMANSVSFDCPEALSEAPSVKPRKVKKSPKHSASETKNGLPTEASQLPPFIVLGPNWFEKSSIISDIKQ